MRRLLLTILGGVLIAASPRVASAAEASVDASVDSSVVNVGDTVRLEVRASIDANTSIRVVSEPDLGSAFQIVGTSRRPQIAIRNGNAHRSLTLTYRIQARKAGEYELAPGAFEIGNERHEPDPVDLRVVESGADDERDDDAASNRARTEDGNVMLTSSIEPARDPYLGEQVTLTYSLLHNPHRASVEPSPPDEPSLEHFWIEELSRKLAGNTRMRRIDGRPMKETILRAYALFPLEDGRVTIEPMGVSVKAGGLFGRGKTADLRTEPIELDVQPLPDGAPSTFYEGNIGSWDFRLTVEERTTSVGDAITVEMVASGTGNARRLELPALEEHLEGIHVANRSEDVDKEIDGTRVSGRKTVTYTLVPTREGDLEIPPVSFAYFDPDQEIYQTIESTRRFVKVGPGTLPDGLDDEQSRETTSEGDETDEETNPRDELLGELVPIRDADAAVDTDPLSPLVWGLGASLPLIGIVALLLSGPLRRRVAHLTSEHSRLRSFRRARERLDVADPRAADEVSDAIHDALQIALVDGLELPAGALSADDLPRRLERLDCPDDLREEVTAIARWCESSRYAPRSSGEPLDAADWLAKTRTALEELEELVRSERLHPLYETSLVVLTVISLLAIPGVAFGAEDPSLAEKYDAALELHAAEDYERAATEWQSLVDGFPDRAAVWHNYAVSLARLDRLGDARLAIERAARRAPNHERIEANLARIRRLVALDRLERAPGFERAPKLESDLEWWKLAASTSLPPLGLATLAGLWLLALGLAVRTFGSRTLTRSLGTLLAAAGLLGLVTTAGLWIGRARTLQTVEPAVVVESTPAREAPSEHASMRSLSPPLTPGTMVRVYRWREGWVQVGALDGERIWLPERALTRIDPTR